jgi:catechol 2,3-dioxygenase
MTSQLPTATPPRLDSATSLGPVSLIVNDLDRTIDFYTRSLGMTLRSREETVATLGSARADLVVLEHDPLARRETPSAGLFHFCIAVPERRQLGQLLRHLVDSEVPLQGLVDHHFAEAIYLADPEGNGIELNWDRPRDEWPERDYVARNGNARLDTDGLLRLADESGTAWDGLPPDARIGHVHLTVGDLAAAERFYVGVLGFERQMEIPAQAVFVSTGGYHHHVAFNIWSGRGIPAPALGAAGLEHFTVRLAGADELGAAIARLHAAGYPVEQTAAGVLTRDPAGLGVLLAV